MLPPFHLAFQVHDLQAARSFYGDILGCSEGRSSQIWVDFNLYGHQIVAHLSDKAGPAVSSNPVDSDQVPVPHFGIILDMEDWEDLAEKVRTAGIDFVIEPKVRFKGEIGEQATMFFLDPSGNALEFKAFASADRIFATD